MPAESFSYDSEDSEDMESDESYMEDGEADEAFVEGDGEADEAFAEGDGEADEAVDEADEGADEADEAFEYTLSDRLRAEQDAERRRNWRASIASQQRREQQRAAAAQQNITDRIRDIRVPSRAGAVGVSPLVGAGVVTLRLQNGRQTQVQVLPRLASAAEVNRLRSTLTANDRRRAYALNQNSRAIARLAATQAVAVKQISSQLVKSDRELGQKIINGDTKLDKRISAELMSQKGAIEKNNKRIFRRIRQVKRRALFHNITIAAALPAFVTYVNRTKLVSQENIVLTGVLSGFLLGDEVIDRIMPSSGKGGRAYSGAADAWAYLAPAGNLLTDFLLYRNKQNERFISGVSTFTGSAPASPPVQQVFTTVVPTASKFNIATVSPAPAIVATIVSDSVVTPTTTAARSVDVILSTTTAGSLAFTFQPPIEPTVTVKVAWIVDTRPPAVSA
jgi:hypothetical protein